MPCRACRAQTAVKTNGEKALPPPSRKPPFQTPGCSSAPARLRRAQHVQLLRQSQGVFCTHTAGLPKTQGNSSGSSRMAAPCSSFRKPSCSICAPSVQPVLKLSPNVRRSSWGRPRDQVDVHVHIPHCNQTPDVPALKRRICLRRTAASVFRKRLHADLQLKRGGACPAARRSLPAGYRPQARNESTRPPECPARNAQDKRQNGICVGGVCIECPIDEFHGVRRSAPVSGCSVLPAPVGTSGACRTAQKRQNAQAYGQPRLVSRYAMRPRRFSRYAGAYGAGGAPLFTQGAERKPRAQPRDGRRFLLRFRPAASDANSMGTLRSPRRRGYNPPAGFPPKPPPRCSSPPAAQNYICARPRSLTAAARRSVLNVPQTARNSTASGSPSKNAGQHVPLRLIDGALPHLGTNTRRACGLHTRQQAPGRQRRMNVFPALSANSTAFIGRAPFFRRFYAATKTPRHGRVDTENIGFLASARLKAAFCFPQNMEHAHEQQQEQGCQQPKHDAGKSITTSPHVAAAPIRKHLDPSSSTPASRPKQRPRNIREDAPGIHRRDSISQKPSSAYSLKWPSLRTRRQESASRPPRGQPPLAIR